MNIEEAHKEYLAKREAIVDRNEKIKYGDMEFSYAEEQANQTFRKILQEQRTYLPEDIHKRWSMKYKNLIDKNAIYKTILKMPKGALHHMHVDCSLDPDWFVGICKNENVYINEETGTLHYFAVEKPGKYIKFLDKVKESENEKEFLEEFRNSLYFTIQEVEKGVDIWKEFMSKIMKTNSLLFYRENYYDYLIKIFTEYYKEGIQHLESRCLLGSVLDEFGVPLPIDDEIKVYLKAVEEFRATHPDFTFVIIAQGLKVWDLQQIDDYLKLSIKTAKKYPDLIKGFDMVMEEDRFKTMLEMSKVFLKKAEYEKEFGITLPYVFHGGESINYATNENLIDVILLDTKRIGHGTNLMKHSYLLDIIKEKQIVIEANPLSNQLINYTYDLRQHPLINYHNYGIKVSINSDDAGFFGSWYICYDFFMVAISLEFDLKDFKRVCLNSLEGSLLDSDKKKQAIRQWEQKWDDFISDFLEKFKTNE